MPHYLSIWHYYGPIFLFIVGIIIWIVWRGYVDWTIVVPDGEVVRLDFSTFNIEYGYDHVDVYDGCTTDDPLIDSYSGDNIPAQINSIGPGLLISFTSDDTVSGQGFSATASGAVCGGTDYGCCTNSSQCGAGGGPCSKDSHCQGELSCGYSNCQGFSHSTPESNRCCTVCNGTTLTPGCCTSSSPCQIGGGVCSSDDQCEGSLKCGTNLCHYFHPDAPTDSSCCHDSTVCYGNILETGVEHEPINITSPNYSR